MLVGGLVGPKGSLFGIFWKIRNLPAQKNHGNVH